jgi:nucleoside-diphosphate-sugar epimerase
MKILVTGTTGFIGTALVRRLGTDPRLEIHAACRRLSDGPFRCHLIGELGAATDWREALSGIDVVVHLAGLAHVRGHGHWVTQEFDRVNHAGSLRLAREAARLGVRRLVFVSSIAVHGLHAMEKGAITTNTPLAPRTPYADSKARAEVALRTIAAESGMELVIIRPPLVHGPSAPGNLGRLVRLVRAGTPLPLGRADNRRSLVSRDNLSSLIHSCVDHPAAAGRTLLAADSRELSTPELVRAIATGLGRRPGLIDVPAWAARSIVTAVAGSSAASQLFGSLRVDASETAKLLGWQPQGDPAAAISEALREAGG